MHAGAADALQGSVRAGRPYDAPRRARRARRAYAGSVHIRPDEIVMTMNVEHHPDLPASEVAARTAELTERIRREHPDVFRVDLQPPPPR